jgi:hypothetical protein
MSKTNPYGPVAGQMFLADSLRTMGLPSSISSTEGMVIGFDEAKKTQVAVQTFAARLQLARE